MSHMIGELSEAAQGFESSSVAGLLRSAPDLEPLVGYIDSLYHSPESGRSPPFLSNNTQLTISRKDHRDPA
jgi:hypothetical protein